MRLSRAGMFLCCVTAIFAGGCPSAPSDLCAGITCDPNEVCLNGTCETVCDGDDDCAAGETCFNGVCTINCSASDSCTCDGDADCNDQDVCTTDSCADQICLNAPISCNTAADCPAGCDVSCGVFSFCSNSIDPCGGCGPGEFCFAGPFGAACVECVDDADCDDDEVCDSPNGDCVECVSDGHCDDDVCDESTNTCVECVANSDCNDFPNNPCIADICEGQNCSYIRLPCNDLSPCPAGCQCVESAGTRICLAPDEID